MALFFKAAKGKEIEVSYAGTIAEQQLYELLNHFLMVCKAQLKSITTLLQKEFPQILQCRWNLGAFLLLLLPIKK